MTCCKHHSGSENTTTRGCQATTLPKTGSVKGSSEQTDVCVYVRLEHLTIMDLLRLSYTEAFFFKYTSFHFTVLLCLLEKAMATHSSTLAWQIP